MAVSLIKPLETGYDHSCQSWGVRWRRGPFISWTDGPRIAQLRLRFLQVERERLEYALYSGAPLH
jgi:hypothetical protein